VLAGSKDARRCIGYLTKYLTKHIGGCHAAYTQAQQDHSARLIEAFRYEPCSPACSNWLRYGVQPRDARPDMIPGLCRGRAHRPENLGYAGRRVLVSRKWSGKTLADHRADRKAWLMAVLEIPATEPADVKWERVAPSDPDYLSVTHRLMHVLTERTQWQAAVAEARRRVQEQGQHVRATGRAA
jgi:hypothetical protein